MQTASIKDQIVDIKKRLNNNERGISNILRMDAKATQDFIDIAKSLKSICTHHPDTEGYCENGRLSFQPDADGSYHDGGRKRSRKKRRKTRRKKRSRKKRRKTRRKKRSRKKRRR